MREAKSGSWWVNHKHRTMANNSAVYNDARPPMEQFLPEWTSLFMSKSGERGIFNRKAAFLHSPKRRKWGRHLPGCNPCAEILLRPFEFCNLSIVIARPDDTRETLCRKVRLATIFGKIQSLCTKFNYIRKDWKDNCEEERLLGVDITGHADCPLLRHTNKDRAALLAELNKVVEETDIELSKRWNVRRSAANTTVKPSGDSAVFFDCASGVSPWFSSHQIRWVRETTTSPVAKFLIDSGVPYAPAPEAPDSMLVFGFPRKAPAGATTRDDMTALQQFYNWLEWKKNWAEHSVSATIYVDDHEWLDLGAAVYENFDQVTGLSFLPKDNGIYSYAPNESVTEEQYREIESKFPDINWGKLPSYEDQDMTEASMTFACVGGSCE
jgi:ribonucleoside-diphosphate reductase alpha chain